MPAIDPFAEPSAVSRILIDAVREAGALALDMFGRELKTWTKSGSSPVCEADIAVDRLLRARLTAAAPDYGWRSEESGDDPARLAAKRVWIVDPIDGTRAYIRGLADWSVAAALVESGRPLLGVIFAPVEAALFAAAAGHGASVNGTAIRASEGSKLDIVGIYPNYAAAYVAWKAKAQQTVDDAQTRYFIVHLHRLLDPSASASAPTR